MKDRKAKLIIGSLLHDIGKVIYREGSDGRNHSISGFDYLKEEAGIEDSEILHCVKYHHASLLKNAKLSEDSLAYIVYLADNIAAFADRREKEQNAERGFELSVPLQSIFNILNGNHQEWYYRPGDMNPEFGINYPSEEKIKFSKEFYQKIRQRMSDNLKGLDTREEYINSLLSVMEANLTYVPSSTAKAEVSDISLFDHVKFTAAIASCIYEYLEETGQSYKSAILKNEKEFYDQNVFLLCSVDISGIQKFIYTITSQNALRTLRARSFYLEIMMEHIIDLLLETLELSRANLMYSGGGHCYLLLANTKNTLEKLNRWEKQMKEWLLENFQTDLFFSCGQVECCANTFRNVPEGSYSELFRKMSEKISEKKLHRYDAKEILWLNHRKADDYTRECKVCKRAGKIDESGQCELCSAIQNFSKSVLYADFFSVVLEEREGLPLPGNYFLVADNERTLKKRIEQDPYFVRAYAKNSMYTGKNVETKLWVGDYTTGQTFEEFAKEAEGIKRIGILRADVDNLGQAFVAGFEGKYATMTRTAVLSRQLSSFFKYYIKFILEAGEYRISGAVSKEPRKATIVYSGGDDVFIVGAWNDIIELSVDLREKFEQYTQGTLTLSAGIGIYESSYPISAIAEETGELEAESKKMPKKDSVTLMSDGEVHENEDGTLIGDGTYTWKELKREVIEEKYQALQEFFGEIDERGMAFLYRLLELIREQKHDRINFARFVYLLSRLEPSQKEKQEVYHKFSRKMYQWIQSEKDCRQLKTAINLYVYMHRAKGEENYAD